MLFSWRGRAQRASATGATGATDVFAGVDLVDPSEVANVRGVGGDADAALHERSGRVAGRREVDVLLATRAMQFVDREQRQLHEQLARAPRDVGALFGLMQWHARRGEARETEVVAHALWDEADADGALWRRAAVVGRSVEPENPLYSEDPFAALAQYAAAQPVRVALPFETLDLSLPDSLPNLLPDVGGGKASIDADASVHFGVLEKGANEEAVASVAAVPVHGETHVAAPVLPSSLMSLSLDFDDLPPLVLPTLAPSKAVVTPQGSATAKFVRGKRPRRLPGR